MPTLKFCGGQLAHKFYPQKLPAIRYVNVHLCDYQMPQFHWAKSPLIVLCKICGMIARYSGSVKYNHFDISAIWLARIASYMYIDVCLYCTKLALKCSHSLFCILASTAWLPQILIVYYGRIWRFGCGLTDIMLDYTLIGSIMIRYPRDRAAKLVNIDSR